VRGDGGIPLRVGLRDGNRSESVEPPVAMEACLALGVAGMRGIVADRQASRRRTLGVGIAHQSDLIPLVPRTCAGRQELAAGGHAQPTLPRVVEKPGRTQHAAPRRWHGPRVRRQVEVEDSDGRGAQEARRLVVGHARQLAQQQTQSYAAAPGKEAEVVAAHVRQGQARWFACRPDAEAALAAYEGQGPGHRGRRPRPWRSHAVRYRRVADTRRTRRARRGRPAKLDPPPLESGERGAVGGEALANPEEDKGWTVLATTGSGESWAAVEILQAYQGQNTTVEPGFRWSKNPAAIAPVWREKPERIAALAMLTVLGLLVYSVIQRQVRLSLRTHDQQLPGPNGLPAPPTAAVVLALCAQVALVQWWRDEQAVAQISGVQPHHRLVCDALGLDCSWDARPSAPKTGRHIQTP
jgi:hypothetical protein